MSANGSRCAEPRITALEARRAGSNPLRAKFRVRAQAERGAIAALHWVFRPRSAAVADLRPRARVSRKTAHTNPRSGPYRISVSAESAAPGCRYRKSLPARLRLRVPVPAS